MWALLALLLMAVLVISVIVTMNGDPAMGCYLILWVLLVASLATRRRR